MGEEILINITPREVRGRHCERDLVGDGMHAGESNDWYIFQLATQSATRALVARLADFTLDAAAAASLAAWQLRASDVERTVVARGDAARAAWQHA